MDTIAHGRVGVVRLLALACSIACRGGPVDSGRDRATATVRDSAGVQIIESAAPSWTERTRWRVDAQPIIDLGGSENDTTQQFSLVRGVHRLPSGLIAVLDAGSHSLRFFNLSGAPIARGGRARIRPR
jgi:hypothetical protein